MSSQREQQLEQELALTRAIIRADASANYVVGTQLAAQLRYLCDQHSREAAVAAWRPYDE